jgi:hypothetical protein
MNLSAEIQSLEALWQPGGGGFFSEVREGRFDRAAYRRALDTLGAIRLPEGAALPRRLVSLVWFIPLFMGWNRPRVIEAGGDAAAYDEAATAHEDAVERLLGMP